MTILTHINGGNELKLGRQREFKVIFTDENNNIIDPSTISFSWNIESDFSDKINMITDDESVKLTVNDKKLLGENFFLQVLIDGTVNSEHIVTIT
jgi:hypothetical protein